MQNHNFQDYFEAVRFLEGLSNIPLTRQYERNRVEPEVYLRRMRYLLGRLGNPEKEYKIIHVTGTAGKGTVCSMLASVLGAAGNRVGLFTSPFSVTTIEKIMVANQYIAPAEFASLVETIKPHLDYASIHCPDGMPSYFEIMNALGFLYFAQKKCDWVVLEVGCGGRYDATNVIPSPVVSAITNVDYDHMHILGKTLTKIAYDKAGIIKKGSAFFTIERRSHLLKIFQTACKEQGALFHRVEGDDPNQALVRATAEHLKISEDAIFRGISNAVLPCRFEIMQKSPLVILDGAHSPAKMRYTAQKLKNISYKKLFLVLGMAGNKDSETICSEIVPYADHIVTTRYLMPFRKCTPPADLLEICKRFKKNNAAAILRHDPWQALDYALVHAKSDDAILVTGSFFLAGELRKKWYPEEWILEHRRSFLT